MRGWIVVGCEGWPQRLPLETGPSKGDKTYLPRRGHYQYLGAWGKALCNPVKVCGHFRDRCVGCRTNTLMQGDIKGILSGVSKTKHPAQGLSWRPCARVERNTLYRVCVVPL